MAEGTVRTKAKGLSDLTVIIEPRSPEVRSLLPDVIDQMETLVRFLRSLTDDDTTFEVKSLSTNSPLTAVLRPLHRTRPPAKRGKPKPSYKYKEFKAPTDRAAKTFTALENRKRLPAYADPYALLQLREFAEDLSKSNHTATIIANNDSYKVDERLKHQIDSSLGDARIAFTSFTGTLERLNVHGARWSFTIFPLVGPSRILCYFDHDELEGIRGLVKEVVTVRGRAVYRGDSPWPVQIRVDSIKRREPAGEGFWNDLPNRLASHWEDASAEEKELMGLEAEGA